MNSNRLYFIDAVRAFAILMMLQGHFIDTLLDTSYREQSNTIFQIWEYFRGITAPTFFTISGLIFSYLLIKAKKDGNSNERMRKGIRRGVMLIGIGYLLRIPIFEWLLGIFNNYFFIIDVLQCIGLSLILIVIIYKLTLKKTLIFSIIMFATGSIIFISEPLYRSLQLPQIPIVLSNYLSKANGSVFTIIPWFGYVAFGAFISTLFYRYVERPKFKLAIVSSFFIVGIMLIFKSSWSFMELYKWLDFSIFKDVAYYNYLFTRLGNVLILFSLFYLAERYIKQPLILKIGQKTLSIYVIHFIIIYGSFTGLGLHQIIGRTLLPWQAIVGAIVFLSLVCFISFYYAKTNAFVYSNLQIVMNKIKRYLD
ncbi:heparan-alpha-glucosaminide N-acetyltransferase domain-containing protein [Winogradskyella bathintestinalis]|uniref:Heparan-alpha-glucosaminide N-acetyltransferase domain-containing protein n=1 Tax=Winogradskyella bathintestinalis TaxID=3035208 RepID=A0ABT7ZVV4_9FLAO|nr:heparan-alpha-glucosaminide N-acetyltransferase domain-containing protein [Winogradskyella bathintestinalis]MDN3493109.1 heparan-alpha-glucosaminide N-acetyltransferase domain-containing protein [Winogradskyella bathintestinalis]